MALNTRDRRGAAIGIDLPTLHVWPNPDAAVTQPDRQLLARKYSGILASGAVVVTMFNGVTTSIRLTGAGAA